MANDDTALECTSIRILLSEYLAGELEKEAKARVSSHLADCDSCRQEMETIRMVESILHKEPDYLDSPETSDDEFSNDVFTAVRVENSIGEKPVFGLNPMVLYAAAVAAAAAIALVWFSNHTRNKAGHDQAALANQEVAAFELVPVPTEQEVLDGLDEESLGAIASALDKDIEELNIKILESSNDLELYQDTFWNMDLDQG